MSSILSFRDRILDYLRRQKELETLDIEEHLSLPYEEKVAKGLLIPDAVVALKIVATAGFRYVLHPGEDNSKLRIGDQVKLYCGLSEASAKIIDFGIGEISIETKVDLTLGRKVSLEVEECVFLDPIIHTVNQMDDGKPGAYFLKILSGEEKPFEGYASPVIPLEDLSEFTCRMNLRQLEAVGNVLRRPSVACIQGPPGTGKTAVLSTLAYAFACAHQEVLILSNTHQTVNNALNKVGALSEDMNVFKIGKMAMTDGLDDCIHIEESFTDYLNFRKTDKKARNKRPADIIGMTLHSAAINLGLRVSGVLPRIVLVDEAGQMPMPYASLIGAFGSGTVVFIGDDKQMPPIYHPDLKEHEFSKSIFEYLCTMYPGLRHTLNITYRMNASITSFISRHFYESHAEGQGILASDYSKDRKTCFRNMDESVLQGLEYQKIVNAVFSSEDSIFLYDVSPHTDDGSNIFTDSNPYEARLAYELVSAGRRLGLASEDMAIITPYRKQSKLIRSMFDLEVWEAADLPLVNTVECLQGQDVELIVISFAATDVGYIKAQLDFLMDPHRLNVMVSRAKTKVVILMGWWLKDWFREHYGF